MDLALAGESMAGRVYAIRTMRREPGFTITALLALGCAIGLNTSLFTIFNAVALRPWPVQDPPRVVKVQRFVREGGGDFGIAEYRYVAQYSRSFAGLIAMRNGEQVKLQDQPLQLTYASGNYFRVLGVADGARPWVPRSGGPRRRAGAVAVISHELWQNRFDADPQIVGRSIRLDDVVFTVIGVTPADFTGTNPLRNDVWTPLSSRKLLRPNDPFGPKLANLSQRLLHADSRAAVAGRHAGAGSGRASHPHRSIPDA